jgi:hypothetical protein
MRSRLSTVAAKLLVFCFVLALTAKLGAAASEELARGKPQPPAPPPASLYTVARYDEATTRFTGRLSGAARDLLSSGSPARGSDTVLVVVLRGVDIRGCEDLGRQLRELRRAAGPERPLVVWTDGAQVDTVSGFLRRERVTNFRVTGVLTRELLEEGPLQTPATLLVLRDGGIIEGVSHPKRLPNMRLRSFAEELTLLLRSAAE